LTEYLARICGQRPLVTIGVWIVLAAAGIALILNLLDSATTTELKLTGGAESQKAANLVEERLDRTEPVIEIIVVGSDSLTVDDPRFRTKVEGVFDRIVALGQEKVSQAFNFYRLPDPSLVSADRKTTIIPVRLSGSIKEATEYVEEVVHIVEEEDASDDFRVLIAGTASIASEANEIAQSDLEQGERFGVVVALAILLVLFGTLIAALVPIILAVLAIIVALGLASAIGQAFELVFFVQMMITMIGLAVGIDYALFIISRFREELARGLSKLEAVERAGAAAGRTVLFSGVTVIIALCGMLLIPSSFFQSIGIGAILVVAVTLAATLTLVPAVLALIGSGVNRLRIPLIGRTKAQGFEEGQEGVWEWITRAVTRFPLISIVAIGAPMVLATYFYFDIQTGLNGVDTLPESAKTREAFFAIEDEFSFGLVNPTTVVIDADPEDPRVHEAILALQTSLDTDESIRRIPALYEQHPEQDLAIITVEISGEPRSPAAVDRIAALREQYIPAAFDGVPAEVHVGGVSAVATDLFGIVDRYTPIVFAFVLGFSFLILMLVFRSIVIPIKAVIMNLLSVGASYGLLVLVFQKGLGTDLFGFSHSEVIDAWIPLFLFTVLFGLSMDYHVFLLSRIRERYDQTGDNAGAVAYGLRSTAGIITGAALIMVAVFGGFAAGDYILNQQVGFGLAVAILLDATLVRSVLVPASMEVLGRRNWYLPSALSWLPDLRVEPAEEGPP
jgi:RND superfamily putative drug exporter